MELNEEVAEDESFLKDAFEKNISKTGKETALVDTGNSFGDVTKK